MSITTAINAARSGLEATSLRADIVATNVANASTPGYVRRSVLLGENVLGGKSSGVLSDGISRSRNEATTAQLRTSVSEVAHANVLAEQRTTLSTAFGDSSEGTGLFHSLSELQTALDAAALTPESESGLQSVLSAAESTISEFDSLSTLVFDLQVSTDNAIVNSVSLVNETLQTIQDLNGKISGIDRESNAAAGLMDERDRALDQLAEFLEIDVVPRDAGQIDVITAEGVYLLHGEAAQIDITVPEGNSTDPIQLSLGGIDITPGAPTYSAISTGQLGALFSFRNDELPAFSAKLDAIASDLASRFSGPDVDPSLAPNEPGLFVFQSATNPTSGLPGSLSINAIVDPSQGGDILKLRGGIADPNPSAEGRSDVLQAMADTLKSTNSIDQGGLRGNFNTLELVSHTASILGQSRVSQSNALAASQAQLAALSEIERSQSGVNLDDQMQQMLLIEQAYAANARIIQVADEMFQRLLEI